MKLPDKYEGFDTEEAYKRYLEEGKKEKINKPKEKTAPLEFKADINPEEFIQTGKNLISKYEPDFTKNFNYEDTHVLVLKKGLIIPKPGLFIPHFLNVVNAFNGKNKLYDGNNRELSRNEIEDIYKHLTKDHINGGAWSWLNSRFVKGSGFNNLDIEYINGLDSNNNLTTIKEPLEDCLMEDCYVDLDFNKQGLAVKKSKKQEYEQGKDIKYWHPRENYVARFYADSDGAFLNPWGSYSVPGVFVCAEGTSKNKNETTR